MKNIILITIMFVFFAIQGVFASENMEAFPPAEDGMARYALNLSPLASENDFMIELIIGKVVSVDQSNTYFFGGKIEKETVKGWGYPVYKLNDLGPMAGTLMAVDPNAPKIDRFIKLGGPPYFVDYNSRLPIVIYVPETVEVRYRIWCADPIAKPMEMH